MSTTDIKTGDTVSKNGNLGQVLSATAGGVVVKWDGGDLTLEKAGDLALAERPKRERPAWLNDALLALLAPLPE